MMTDVFMGGELKMREDHEDLKDLSVRSEARAYAEKKAKRMAEDTKFSGKKEEYKTGAVRDKKAGKGRYDLVSPHMIRRLAGVYERGAVHYGDNNWKKGMPFSSFYDSALRHTYQALNGETDEDHLCQAIWNLTCLVHFQEEGREAELDNTKDLTSIKDGS